jgi:hypothetical protein
MIIKDGEEVSFRYAFVFLGGDKASSKVADIYHKWSTAGK